MTVTESLKRFRNSRKLRQSDIADFLGITPQMYQYYESKGELSANVIKKIADAFKVSTDYLLGLTDNPAPHWNNSVNTEHLEYLQATIDKHQTAINELATRLKQLESKV